MHNCRIRFTVFFHAFPDQKGKQAKETCPKCHREFLQSIELDEEGRD